MAENRTFPMTPMTYPARIVRTEDGDFLVTFTDIPEALSGASTFEEAQSLAGDALDMAIGGYIEASRPLPPSRQAAPGEVPIAVDPQTAARALLVRAMADQRLSKVALAERIGQDEKAVRRMISGKGASFGLVLKALKAMGIRPALAA